MKDHETVPPLLIDRAEGVFLYDAQGNSYLDGISSWWVNLMGHNHPRINRAIQEQMEKMSHVMFAGITHRPAIDLAETLVKLSSFNLSKVFFSDNGSTSVEVALKLSLQYWQLKGGPKKTRFIYLKGAYHGETLGALSTCGIDMFRDKFEAVLPDHREVPGPDCFRCPFGLQRDTCQAECFEPMEQALNQHAGETAAVIIEPLVQGAAGMRMYPAVYLKKLEQSCREKNVHTIFDEVAVGFGRTGSLFVSEGLKLQPTFLCLSKGITSGYLPLAATLTEDSIYDAFYDDFSTLKWFIHSHSYSANPLACAAANETLSLLQEPGFFESLQPKIELFGQLGREFEPEPWCGEYRQTGMMAAVELVADQEAKTPFPFEQRVGYRIYLEGLKRGVFLRPLGNVVYFMPPLVIEPEQIRFLFQTARQCIEKIWSELGNV